MHQQPTTASVDQEIFELTNQGYKIELPGSYSIVESILSWRKETRHLLLRISWLLEKLDTFLKNQINLQQKIYKMSPIWLLYLKAFRNGKQKKENSHIQN